MFFVSLCASAIVPAALYLFLIQIPMTMMIMMMVSLSQRTNAWSHIRTGSMCYFLYLNSTSTLGRAFLSFPTLLLFFLSPSPPSFLPSSFFLANVSPRIRIPLFPSSSPTFPVSCVDTVFFCFTYQLRRCLSLCLCRRLLRRRRFPCAIVSHPLLLSGLRFRFRLSLAAFVSQLIVQVNFFSIAKPARNAHRESEFPQVCE
jgi:hypothetical protein